MARLTKEGAGKAVSVRTADVSVHEFGDGVTVGLRGLTVDERDRLEDWTKRKRDKRGNLTTSRGIMAKLVTLCAVGDDGKSVFTETDIPTLQGWPSEVLGRVYEKALELSGMGDTAARDAEKNSETTES